VLLASLIASGSTAVLLRIRNRHYHRAATAP